MTVKAPPGRTGAPAGAARMLGVAAFGGAVAFVVLIVVCGLLGVVPFLLTETYGLWSWVKIGLLTALLSLRADVLATVNGSPILPTAVESVTLHVRFVPMALTIGFLWLVSRAGRRAARTGRSSTAIVTAGVAAAGAGVSVAILSAACSSLVALFFPAGGLRLAVDLGSAALWGGALAAAGAATGAYLEGAHGRTSAAVLRGGLAAYGWALGLLAVGVLVVATLEPTVTRNYVDGTAGLGTGGAVLLGYHVLAIPAQSALVLAPALGSCVEVVGEGSVSQLCPWRLVASGPADGVFFLDPLVLSPWLWLLSGVPLIAAMLGGKKAAISLPSEARGAVGLGVAAGSVFALLVMGGAWFVAPRWFATPVVVPNVIPLSHITVGLDWTRTVVTALIWGALGGGLGAWLATRYGEPELPRPTSA